jgi:SAM-dependent methyltransferase
MQYSGAGQRQPLPGGSNATTLPRRPGTTGAIVDAGGDYSGRVAVAYQLLYLVGVKPWERGGVDRDLARFLDLEEQTRTPPYGRALDLGCGTGLQTIELARRGWNAVGVDNVPRAIHQARRRSATGSVRFVLGDVSNLAGAGVGDGFDLFVDRGCFQGLDDTQRETVARAVTDVAASDAVLLMFAWGTGVPRPLPRGAEPGDVAAIFDGWELTDVEELSSEGMPPPLRRRQVSGRWLRLQRG